MSENEIVDMTQIVLGKFLISVDSKTAKQILNGKNFEVFAFYVSIYLFSI